MKKKIAVKINFYDTFKQNFQYFHSLLLQLKANVVKILLLEIGSKFANFI